MSRFKMLCLAVCLSPAFAQPLPTLDAVLARYVQELGGQAALASISTRAAWGTIESPTYGSFGEYQEQAQRPDRIVRGFRIAGYGVVQDAFDGGAAWSELPEYGVTTLTGNRAQEIRREAQFDWPLHLKQIYPNLHIAARGKLLDRDVIEAAAALPEGGQVRLLFDSESGLLACIEAPETAPGGVSRPVRLYYEDYRKVEGVMVPHFIRHESADLIWIVRRTVVHNGPVDARLFQKP